MKKLFIYLCALSVPYVSVDIESGTCTVSIGGETAEAIIRPRPGKPRGGKRRVGKGKAKPSPRWVKNKNPLHSPEGVAKAFGDGFGEGGPISPAAQAILKKAFEAQEAKKAAAAAKNKGKATFPEPDKGTSIGDPVPGLPAGFVWGDPGNTGKLSIVDARDIPNRPNGEPRVFEPGTEIPPQIAEIIQADTKAAAAGKGKTIPEPKPGTKAGTPVEGFPGLTWQWEHSGGTKRLAAADVQGKKIYYPGDTGPATPPKGTPKDVSVFDVELDPATPPSPEPKPQAGGEPGVTTTPDGVEISNQPPSVPSKVKKNADGQLITEDGVVIDPEKRAKKPGDTDSGTTQNFSNLSNDAGGSFSQDLRVAQSKEGGTWAEFAEFLGGDVGVIEYHSCETVSATGEGAIIYCEFRRVNSEIDFYTFEIDYTHIEFSELSTGEMDLTIEFDYELSY